MTQKNKQRNKIAQSRTKFLSDLKTFILALHKALTANGYKSYPFVLLLKELKTKCDTDKSKVNKL